MGRQTADGAERTERSAPPAWRITFRARIADCSVIPLVRTGRSGGPVRAPLVGSGLVTALQHGLSLGYRGDVAL